MLPLDAFLRLESSIKEGTTVEVGGRGSCRAAALGNRD